MGCIHKTVLGIFSWLLPESPHNPVGVSIQAYTGDDPSTHKTMRKRRILMYGLSVAS